MAVTFEQAYKIAQAHEHLPKLYGITEYPDRYVFHYGLESGIPLIITSGKLCVMKDTGDIRFFLPFTESKEFLDSGVKIPVPDLIEMNDGVTSINIDELKIVAKLKDVLGMPFIYDEHKYWIVGYDDDFIVCEYNSNDEAFNEKEFAGIDEALSNYRVHTGEKLIDIIPKAEVDKDNCTVDINYIRRIMRGEIPKDEVENVARWW